MAAEAIASAGTLDDEQISDLAFHSYHAALDGDPGPARERTLAAGRRAGQRLAFEDAARWLSLALELAGREPVRAQDLLQLLFEAADADRCAGLVSSARVRYERAAQIARQLEDRPALIRAALGIGSAVVTAGRVDWDLAALLEEAAKIATSQADRARLESRLAIELYWYEGGEPSRAQSLVALRTAERSNDPAALGVALHARQFTLRSREHLDERIDIGERLLALAHTDRHGELAFQGAVWLAADVMRAGDLTRFRGLAELLQAAAARSHFPLQRWYATVMAAQLASVEGRVEKAYELAEGAAVLGARLGLDIAAAYRLGQLCVLHREREGLHSLIPDIEEVSARLPYFVTIRGFAALAAATTGHCDAAAWEINRVSGNGFDAIPRDSLWVATIALFTEAAAICGSPHTGQLAELLAPHRGTFVVQGIPCCWGSVDRFLGRAAIALSDWDAATSALADAADMEAKLAAPLFVARTTLDQARLAAAVGKRDNARRLATQVRAVADRLGLAALSREAVQLLATPNDQSGLSRREREVLGLLSGGATNKEIAARLVISLNTVERHLANIYTKLGVRGRAEAAAYAVRTGLEMTAGNGGSP
jgi:DNA-binding CsgD family transcriptional regulator